MIGKRSREVCIRVVGQRGGSRSQIVCGAPTARVNPSAEKRRRADPSRVDWFVEPANERYLPIPIGAITWYPFGSTAGDSWLVVEAPTALEAQWIADEYVRTFLQGERWAENYDRAIKQWAYRASRNETRVDGRVRALEAPVLRAPTVVREQAKDYAERVLERMREEARVEAATSRPNPSAADKELSRALLNQGYLSPLGLKALKQTLRWWDIEYEDFIIWMNPYRDLWADPWRIGLRDAVNHAYHLASNFEGRHRNPLPDAVEAHWNSIAKRVAREYRRPHAFTVNSYVFDNAVQQFGLHRISMSAAGDPMARADFVKWMEDNAQ